MAVAKEGGRAECRPQLEEAALLGRAIYTGRAQGSGKPHANRGAQGPGLSLSLSPSLSPSLSLFESFGSACPHASKMYFPLFSKQN